MVGLPRGLHKDFSGGGEAEHERPAGGFFCGGEAGGEIALGHADGFSGEQAVVFDELEELGGLVRDADDA